MSMETRKALESSKLPFFDPSPIEWDWDRPLRNIKGIYKGLLPLGFLLMHMHYRSIEVHGLWNIPKEGGFVMAANHQSSWDPVSIYYGMKGRRVMYVMAKEEFFHTFYTRWLFTFLNAFPVYRDRSDKDSLEFAKRVIQNGYALLLFPSGTRDLSHGKPANFKPGAALLAREAKADVMPVSIHLEKRKFRPKIIIRYGDVIPFKELGFTEGSRKSKELRAASAKIEGRVSELWEMDSI